MLLQETLRLDAETQRLQALRPYRTMVESQHPVFREVVKLTAKIFLAQTVLLSLIDADTVFHASNTGLPDLPSTISWEYSICATAVYQNGTTVFSDLQHAPCPWVRPDIQASSGIAFYAGHPLTTVAGQPIGMLCVLDQNARTFSPEEQLVLERLAGLSMRVLDLQLALTHEPAQSPVVWQAINERISLSIQRLETLTALAQWETSPETPAAQSYITSMHEERLLITQNIDREISIAFACLTQEGKA